MANVIYEDKLYNTQIKQEFIENYSESTQKTISRIFKVSGKKEYDYNTDLFDLSREQIRKLLFLYMPKTDYSSKLNVTWIVKYIDWAIENGYCDGMNPLEGIDRSWSQQFVNNTLKKFWTEREIEKIIMKLTNAQDAVIVSLLFNGARGPGNSEILNLKKQDIQSSENQLLLNAGTENHRVIKVDEKCIKLCEAALREVVYEKSNGNPSKDLKAKPTAELVSNDYVVKSSITRTDHQHEAEKNIIHRRLSNIGREIDETNFTPLNIVYSGMLHLAKVLVEQSGKLDKAQTNMIFERFGESSEQVKYRIKAEFLNLDYVKQFYGL